jgi:hypothetical protein
MVRERKWVYKRLAGKQMVKKLRDQIKKLEEKIKQEQSVCNHKWEITGMWDEDDGWSLWSLCKMYSL